MHGPPNSHPPSRSLKAEIWGIRWNSAQIYRAWWYFVWPICISLIWCCDKEHESSLSSAAPVSPLPLWRKASIVCRADNIGAHYIPSAEFKALRQVGGMSPKRRVYLLVQHSHDDRALDCWCETGASTVKWTWRLLPRLKPSVWFGH